MTCPFLRARGSSTLPNTASSKSNAPSSSSNGERTLAWPVAISSSSGPGVAALVNASSVNSEVRAAGSTFSAILTE